MTFANVMSVTAVFIALGGSALAINKIKANSVGSKQLKTGAVKNADLADNSVTSPKVADGSLLGVDFKSGELPAGAQGIAGPTGPQGPQGQQGVQGATGTVDTSNFYDKAASDARFLGITATASNSIALGAIPAATFPTTTRDANTLAVNGNPKLGFARRSLPAASGFTTILNIGLLGRIDVSCSDPAQPSIRYRNTQGSAEDVWIQNMIGGAFSPFASVGAGADSATVVGTAAVQGSSRFQFIVGSGTTASGQIGVFDVTTATAPGGGADNSCLIQVRSQSFTAS
jgi:hypothetical protein